VCAISDYRLRLFPLFLLSQFIVVSLKEGMFNHANVLFRTKFIDGVSAVIRTTADKKGIKA
jgi:structural maintenance of chromosome 2